MFGWITPSIVTPGGWGTASSDAWRNWKYKQPKIMSPGYAVIFHKCAATTFMEELLPEKIREITKRTLFDLLPTDILNYAYI